jgi:hypothetical protein
VYRIPHVEYKNTIKRVSMHVSRNNYVMQYTEGKESARHERFARNKIARVWHTVS